MSEWSLINELESIVNQMRTVDYGDEVRSEDYNLFVDYCTKAVELLKMIYNKYTNKYGKGLPLVDSLLPKLDVNLIMLNKVASGDLIQDYHHNYVLDTLKMIEICLLEIEKNL